MEKIVTNIIFAAFVAFLGILVIGYFYDRLVYKKAKELKKGGNFPPEELELMAEVREFDFKISELQERLQPFKRDSFSYSERKQFEAELSEILKKRSNVAHKLEKYREEQRFLRANPAFKACILAYYEYQKTGGQVFSDFHQKIIGLKSQFSYLDDRAKELNEALLPLYKKEEVCKSRQEQGDPYYGKKEIDRLKSEVETYKKVFAGKIAKLAEIEQKKEELFETIKKEIFPEFPLVAEKYANIIKN